MSSLTIEDTNLVFKAFADENRLRILSLLANSKEVCVCDIENVLEMPQSKVSRHLAYLRRAELVEPRQEGKWVYYRIAKHGSCLSQKLVNCIKTCLNDIEMLQEDMKRLNRVCGTDCC